MRGKWLEVQLEKIQANKQWALNGGPFGSKLVQRDYVESGVPVIRGANLSGDCRFNLNDFVYVTEQKANDLLPNNAHPGDVVFTQRGTLGQVGIIPKQTIHSRFVISQSQMKITVDEAQAHPPFVYYYFRNPLTVKQLENHAYSSGVPHINLAILREFPICLPPLPTQRKIAAVLSAYDDLIENNNRRIKILEEMARLIYREWFVNFRFPGHEILRLVDSPLGKIPEEWKVVPLDDVCSRITDGSHYSPKTVDDGYPMASVKDMHDWGINVDTCRKISKDEFENLHRNDCVMKKDDVLIAKDGSYLKHCFVVEQDANVAILSSIAILRPNQRISPHLLSMILADPNTKTRMKGYVSGAALPRIILKDFKLFQVVLPPSQLQNEWEEVTIPVVELCQRLIQKNHHLRQTRDLLLPKLISGELDVSELDIDTSEEAE